MYRPSSSLVLGIGIVTAALVLGLTVGCRSSDHAGESDILRIGVLAPFNTPPGEGIRDGVAMAVAEINEAGGIDGKRLEVVEFNTEYSAEKAARGYQRLADREGVVAVLGVAGEGIFPIMEQLRRYKVPMITTGTGSDRLTELVAEKPEEYRWFFRVMHKSSELGEATADFAVRCLAEQHGLRRFALLVEDDIWTKYVRDIWADRLNGDGTEIVFSDTFSSHTKDYGVLFQQIINSQADYILDACSRVDATTYLKRWAAIDGPPIGAIPTGAGTERYYQLIGDKGLLVTSVATLPSPENPLTENSADWWERYYAVYGDTSYTSGYSYDATYILAEALERAGSTDVDDLIAALEETDHVGVSARWVFGPDHHPLYGPGYRIIPIMQYQEPGPRGFRVVWPPELATADLILKDRGPSGD